MKSTDIARNFWIGTLKTHQDFVFVGAKVSKIVTHSQDCRDDMPIKRNEYGTIDYKYYAKKGRQIRSKSAGLVFKALISYMTVLGSILFVMI
ncbi:hypothetical protein [Desulfogranum marinum]|jgi:hypothetical protein|uniref:hypothetical protein n=1 Tax=Desulfogranum marinum TaxID=453220 RepID=UPI0029C6F867|nr:hypothetical protein [Desulfogranum marinum]